MRNYRARGITNDGKPIFDEAHEHVAVAQWLTVNQIFFTHAPNGEWRHKATARKLKRMGVRAGCPDFLIFDRNRQGRPTALELKALDGRTPSEDQKTFLDALQRLGWSVSWQRGADAAIKWLEEVGYGRISR